MATLYYFSELDLAAPDYAMMKIGTPVERHERCKLGMDVRTTRTLAIGGHGRLYEVTVPDDAITSLPVTYLHEWERTRSKGGRTGGNEFIASLHHSLKNSYKVIMFQDYRGRTEQGLVLDLSCIAAFKKIGEYGVAIGIAAEGGTYGTGLTKEHADAAASYPRPKMRV